MSLGLHHIALGARDVERVAAFYRDVLGLPEVRRNHTGSGELRSVWLDLGHAVLMIEHTDQPPRRVDGIGSGLFLLAVRVGAEERRALEQRLGPLIEATTEHSSYARDPEGNRVAVSHHPLLPSGE